MKKVLSIIGAIVVILLFVFFIFFISDKAANKNFENISYSEYKELKGTTDMVVYIGEEDFIDSIKTIARENNINFKYLNYDKLSDKEKKEFDNEEQIEIWKDKELKDVYTFDEFTLKEGEEPNKIKTVSASEYEKLIKEDGLHFMYVGSETCHYCEMYNEAINEFYEEYNTDIYYVNLYAASDEDRTKLYATNEYFQGDWGTPTSMIYYNGEVLEIISGYRDKDSLVEILENVYLKAFLIDNKVL